MAGVEAKIGFHLIEVKGSVWAAPATASLAHCVSRDFKMGAGVAVGFKEKFGGVAELEAQNKRVGETARLVRGGRYIFYLVTKERYFHKPTHGTFTTALLDLAGQCSELGVTELALPHLGCGLDRLRWTTVKGWIIEVFKNHNITITAYDF